jgi:hypothetical protein
MGAKLGVRLETQWRRAAATPAVFSALSAFSAVKSAPPLALGPWRFPLSAFRLPLLSSFFMIQGMVELPTGGLTPPAASGQGKALAAAAGELHAHTSSPGRITRQIMRT